MSRWNNYVKRIDEKVSKKEIDTALKNDNILIGCEFEWKLDNGLSEYGGKEMAVLQELAVKEYEEYEYDLKQYERDLQEYEEETEDIRSKIKKADERIDELTDALSDQEEYIDELSTNIEEAESEKGDVESELETHETDKNVWELEGNIRDWEAVKRELNTSISNLKADIDRYNQNLVKNGRIEDKWNKEIEKLERDKYDMEDDVKYREEDGFYEETETPHCSKNTMPNYFEYMMEYAGYSERELKVDPGEEIRHYPHEMGDGNGIEYLEQAVVNSGILDDAPFKHYDIGSYGSVRQSVGSREWVIEDDSSLGDDGLEVKNPPMELPKFMKNYLGNMFDWIENHGYTDSDCGFHCHMSVKNPKGSEIDFLKLIMFTDEGWIYNAFTERTSNSYAGSVKNKLMSKGIIDEKDTLQLFARKKLLLKLQMKSEHFDAINDIDNKGHVEFRYMGGPNYHKKEKDVTALIGVYAHNLSLAMDPEYKRKEYILKLQRVFNKMEMFQHKMNIQVLRVIMKKVNDEGGYLEKTHDMPIIQRLEKEELAKFNRLSSTYKLDGGVESTLKSNKAFMAGVAGVSNDLFRHIGVGVSQVGNQETNSWW